MPWLFPVFPFTTLPAVYVLPVMGYIITLVILLFIGTAVKIIPYFWSGPVTGHLLILQIILRPATFHNT